MRIADSFGWKKPHASYALIAGFMIAGGLVGFCCFSGIFLLHWSLLIFTLVVEGEHPAGLKQMYMGRQAEYSLSYQMELMTLPQPGLLF